MVTLSVIGLAAVAVGPVLAILLDRADATVSAPSTTSAGMFAAVNDNAFERLRRAG